MRPLHMTEVESGLFWDVTQLRLVGTDVSGRTIGLVLKSRAVLDGTDSLSGNVGT